jgi:hypothetical protein
MAGVVIFEDKTESTVFQDLENPVTPPGDTQADDEINWVLLRHHLEILRMLYR